jgi:hypothetical protein
MTHIPDPPPANPPPANAPPGTELPQMIGDGTLRVQEWAVPAGWPPLWLVGVTALGLVLAVADWRRERRRRAAAGGPPS